MIDVEQMKSDIINAKKPAADVIRQAYQAGRAEREVLEKIISPAAGQKLTEDLLCRFGITATLFMIVDSLEERALTTEGTENKDLIRLAHKLKSVALEISDSSIR